MTVLVVGGGGREHAVIWKLLKDNKDLKIYCAPGNGGIRKLCECVDIKATDIDSIVAFTKEKKVDLVVVTPDDPLVLGMVDALNAEGIRAFGPSKAAAILEGSKVFSKNLMKKYGIPTARYETFASAEDAVNYIKKENSFPAVIKADGLALGKGVIIAQNLEEAEQAVKEIMCDGKFGSSGNHVVIEQFLSGFEVSVLSFTDGKTIVPMVSARDYKRALDGDKGLNTGGMGNISPNPLYTDEIAEKCMNKIFLPTVDAMNKEGRTFKGVIFFGLMVCNNEPYVIEYNARFGDPETQVVLPRLKTNLLTVMNAVIDGSLDKIKIEWDKKAAACVVMASGGYPGKYQTGYPITGLDSVAEDITVFHAGTKITGGKIVTSGGRVLGITAMGENLDTALDKAYKACESIHFEGSYFRHDIGKTR